MRTPHPGISQSEWNEYYYNPASYGSAFAHRSHDEHCGYQISTFATCSPSGTIRFGYSLSSAGFGMSSGAKYSDRARALNDAVNQAKIEQERLENEVQELENEVQELCRLQGSDRT